MLPVQLLYHQQRLLLHPPNMLRSKIDPKGETEICENNSVEPRRWAQFVGDILNEDQSGNSLIPIEIRMRSITLLRRI